MITPHLCGKLRLSEKRGVRPGTRAPWRVSEEKRISPSAYKTDTPKDCWGMPVRDDGSHRPRSVADKVLVTDSGWVG